MMEWLDKLLGRSRPPAEGGAFPAPWDRRRPSIYGFLKSFAASAEGGLPPAAATLPDEDAVLAAKGMQMRWAPGALEGAFGHHGAGAGMVPVEHIVNMLASATKSRSVRSIEAFYHLAEQDEVLGIVDPLMDRLRESRAIAPERLRAFARWLATESPDRGAVKIAIALLGMVAPPRDLDLLITLGLHEEFTLYAAVALGSVLSDAERETAWWSLARRVHGWGRIHLVERLAGTRRPDIKAWMLREGYKNSVMVEYLAHPCATSGDLLSALRDESADEALLEGAGDILQALINGGPAKDMADYADGAAVVARYLHHVALQPPGRLATFLAVHDIAAFAADEHREWQPLEALGWTREHRAAMAARAGTILGQAAWRDLAMQGLRADDEAAFWAAATVAEKLGIDAWDIRFERQASGRGDQWFHLMRTDDTQRIDHVLDLARTQLDLGRIAAGPSTSLGLGPEFKPHAALDFILQSLGRFPARGWDIVAAGLCSPSVRNRNMALKTLSQWGRDAWPAEADAALVAALKAEPDTRVRGNIENVMAGRPLA